jgi:hypothetical protein
MREVLGQAYGMCNISKDFIDDYIEDFIDAGINYIYDFEKLTVDLVIDADDKAKILQETKKVISELSDASAPVYSGKAGKVKSTVSYKNRPMTPVSSSMIAGRNVSNKKVYVRMHNTPNRSYKLKFPSNEEALEAYEEMASGSPGRWYWNNIRGHKKGSAVTDDKLGPVYGNPSKETIGGTSASKVEYEPVSTARIAKHIVEVPNFEAISKQLRAYKMAVKEPATSGEAFTVAELRKAEKLGIQPPKVDMKDKTTHCNDCKKEKPLFYQNLCKECYKKVVNNKSDYIQKVRHDLEKHEKKEKKLIQKKIGVKQKGTGQRVVPYKQKKSIQKKITDMADFTHDVVIFRDVNKLSLDNENFSILKGTAVKEGWYNYNKGGKIVKLYKNYDNLKEAYGSLDYVPLRGTKETGSHFAPIIGFMHNFVPNDNKRAVDMEIVTFDDMSNLSDLPLDSNWQLSMGFEDKVIGDQQYVGRVDHGAISLNNLELGRCGDACTARMVSDFQDQNLTEVDNPLDNLTDFDTNLNKKGGNNMPKDKEKDKKNKKNENENMPKDKEGMSTDAADDIENNAEIAQEVESIMKTGKTRVEAQEQVARERKAGKHDTYGNPDPDSITLPEFTDTGKITPDMITELFSTVKALKSENEKLRNDFSPYLEKRKAKIEKDFSIKKDTLIKEYDICKDFVSKLNYKDAKIINDAFEKSGLVKEALFYKVPLDEEQSVLDMDEVDDKNDEFSYLKVS